MDDLLLASIVFGLISVVLRLSKFYPNTLAISMETLPFLMIYILNTYPMIASVFT